MEKETMYWLFTTAPQAIAALVGIIFTECSSWQRVLITG